MSSYTLSVKTHSTISKLVTAILRIIKNTYQHSMFTEDLNKHVLYEFNLKSKTLMYVPSIATTILHSFLQKS